MVCSSSSEDVSNTDNYMEKCSTMKDTYRYPTENRKLLIGERKTMLLKQFYNEAIAEVSHASNSFPSNNTVSTEYMNSYNKNEVSPNSLFCIDKQLYGKYPLYTTVPMSFWEANIKKTDGQLLQGVTTITDLGSPFKRNSSFTDPSL